jgi:hypothetical protein
MKFFKYLYFLGLILLIALITACGNDDIPQPAPEPQPTLPPITSNGSGTFGAMINGEVWVPKYHTTWGADLYTPGVSYSEIDLKNLGIYRGIFGLGAGQYYPETNTDVLLRFFVDTVYSIGEYKFTAFLIPNNYSTTYEKYKKHIDDVYDEYYILRNPSVNKLNITRLDTVNNIISGTFEVDLLDTITGNIMEIRDGRFDLTYH